MSSYVAMLEKQQAQLVAGVQELYRRLKSTGAWDTPAMTDTTQGVPLSHEILAQLGILDRESSPEPKHSKDIEAPQGKLPSNDILSTQHELPVHAACAAERPACFGPTTCETTPTYTTLKTTDHFPLIIPTGMYLPFSPKENSLFDEQMSTLTSQTSNTLSWQLCSSEGLEAFTSNMGYDSPVVEANIQAMTDAAQVYKDPTEVFINPCLTFNNWRRQEEQIPQVCMRDVFDHV